jgi:hypothetical protein
VVLRLIASWQCIENIIQNGDVDQGATRSSSGDFAKGERQLEAFRHHVRSYLVEHTGNLFQAIEHISPVSVRLIIGAKKKSEETCSQCFQIVMESVVCGIA